MNKDKDENFLDPRSPITKISDEVVLYAINNSDSNIVLTDGTNTATLTAPGFPGSIQVINKNMLKSPGFMALWSIDKIRVSTSLNVGQRAVSSIQIQAEKEKAHKENIRKIIVDSEDISEGGTGKQTDESFKAQRIVDSSVINQQNIDEQSEDDKPVEDNVEDEVEPEQVEEKPTTRGRRTSKKNRNS